jgi:hypothetical protein
VALGQAASPSVSARPRAAQRGAGRSAPRRCTTPRRPPYGCASPRRVQPLLVTRDRGLDRLRKSSAVASR